MSTEIICIDHRDPDQFADWYRVFEAAWTADKADYPVPPESRMAAFARGRTETHEQRYWVGREDDRVVGAVEDVRPIRDNTDVLLGEIYVEPGHRRRGHGTALFEAVRDHAAAAGRRRWIGAFHLFPEGGRAARPFAGALGFAEALREHIVRLDPPFARSGSWLAETRRRAAPFEIVTWTGAVADAWLEDSARLQHRMVLDAPMGDLGYEPEAYDAERVRSGERFTESLGLELWGSGAVRDGRLVAVSHLAVDVLEDRPAFQWDTIVDPDHRGNRLGLAVKWANLERVAAERPDVTAIYSENAADNEPMLAVNRLLGFEIVGDSIECQLEW